MALIRTAGRLAQNDRLRSRLPALADPFVSSLSNVLVFFLVARSFDAPEPVGAFAIAMVAYNFALGGTRAVVGEPLMSRHSAASPEDRLNLVAGILSTTLLIAAGTSGLVWVLSVLVGGMSGSALAALALVLPVLLLQDAWRFIFVIDRPMLTLVVDVVWLVVVLLALPLAPADASVSWFVVVWGLGAAVGALAGFLLHGKLSGSWNPWRWLVDHRQMAWRFFGEFQIGRGVFELALVGLAVVAGLGALGAVKAAVVFYGFLNTLNGGLNLAVIPEGVRLRKEPRRLQKLMVGTAGAVASISVLWLLIGVTLPDSLGRFAFNATWDEGKQVMLPMGLAMVARGIKHGGFLGLRSLADARRSFSARLVTAPFEVACPLAGAMVGGAGGFAVGFAVSQAVAAWFWWLYFRRGLSHGPEMPEPGQDRPFSGIDASPGRGDASAVAVQRPAEQSS